MKTQMKNWFDDTKTNPVKGLVNLPQLVATLFVVPALVVGSDAHGMPAAVFTALPFANVTAPLIVTLLLWGLQVALLFAFATDFRWTIQREEWKGGWCGGFLAFLCSLTATSLLISNAPTLLHQAWSGAVGFVTYVSQSSVATAVAVPACLFAAAYLALRIGKPIFEMQEKANEEAERRKKQ